MQAVDVNSWYSRPDHGQLCQVIEAQVLRDKVICRVWMPGRDSVVRLPASRPSAPGECRDRLDFTPTKNILSRSGWLCRAIAAKIW
jgi:hypothetical protein